VDILTDRDLLHPADALATALDRVSGLLAVLGDLYNPRSDNFSGGNEFIMHALSTASSLAVEARGALSDLHNNCDLTLIVPADNQDVTEAAIVPDVEPVRDSASVELPIEPLKWTIDRGGDRADVAPKVAAPTVSEQDHFAKSYLELLRKLTAAEVFASEQQALAAPGLATDLLPLLRGLREDFQKMHKAG
jgi:hypothetical protein